MGDRDTWVGDSQTGGTTQEYVVGTYGLGVLAHYRGLLEKAGPHLSPEPLTGRHKYSWSGLELVIVLGLLTESHSSRFGGWLLGSPRKVWVDGEKKVYFVLWLPCRGNICSVPLSLQCPRRPISQNTVGRSNWLIWEPPLHQGDARTKQDAYITLFKAKGGLGMQTCQGRVWLDTSH